MSLSIAEQDWLAELGKLSGLEKYPDFNYMELPYARHSYREVVRENRKELRNTKVGTPKERLSLAKTLSFIAYEAGDTQELDFQNGRISILEDLVQAEEEAKLKEQKAIDDYFAFSDE